MIILNRKITILKIRRLVCNLEIAISMTIPKFHSNKGKMFKIKIFRIFQLFIDRNNRIFFSLIKMKSKYKMNNKLVET